MKKLVIFLIVILIGIFIAIPVRADHYGYSNQFSNHYGGFYNHGGAWNNRFHNPYGYHPRRHGRPYGGWHSHRNNDLAGIIIGGIIIMKYLEIMIADGIKGKYVETSDVLDMIITVIK